MANPNPSPETRFGAENGNPSGAGKSKGQRAAEIKAAEISAQLRERALSELLERVKGKDRLSDQDLEGLLNPATLKLFKDSEDRAHGTPKQAVDHTTNGKDMSPTTIVIKAADDDSDN
jgi:hypothetical protein